MNHKRQVFIYLIFDFLAAASTWTLFNIYRKTFIESVKFGHKVPILLDEKFFFGLIIIPCLWIFLYYIIGYYRNIYRKSRLKEFGTTLLITTIGVIIIFFVLILDDTILTYKNYYASFMALFLLQFFLSYIPRSIITTITIHKIQNGIINFNTLLIGGDEKAFDLYQDLKSKSKSAGKTFIGFVNINGNTNYQIKKHLKHLGNIDDLPKIIKEYNVEETIIAIERNERNKIKNIIDKLEGTNVVIETIPDIYDMLTGSVKISSIFGAPLVQLSHDLMPAWQISLKRIIDVVGSIIALIILTPVLIFIAIGIKLTSKGPIFYNHQRIGHYGKPFKILKFRTMYVDAEKNGPALSSKNDERITHFGHFLRKMRLDELPQFYNVIEGDMSIVGPRPEREFYINQIVQTAPHYKHLLKVRPGITSWGQVRYGYAENVEQMIERLKYDIIYIENMSLYVDFKIMIYTIKTVLEGKGL